MQVRNHRRAQTRVGEIEDYYAGIGIGYKAYELFDVFEGVIKHLPAHPKLFPIFYRRATPPPPRGFRRAVLADYSIVYVVAPERDAILIVDYWHNARNPDDLAEALARVRI